MKRNHTRGFNNNDKERYDHQLVYEVKPQMTSTGTCEMETELGLVVLVHSSNNLRVVFPKSQKVILSVTEK